MVLTRPSNALQNPRQKNFDKSWEGSCTSMAESLYDDMAGDPKLIAFGTTILGKLKLCPHNISGAYFAKAYSEAVAKHHITEDEDEGKSQIKYRGLHWVLHQLFGRIHGNSVLDKYFLPVKDSDLARLCKRFETWHG